MNLSCQQRSDHHCVKADNTPHAVSGGTNQTASRRDVCCRSLFDSFAGVSSEDDMSSLDSKLGPIVTYEGVVQFLLWRYCG
jgi:hypothetical protein